MAVLVMFHMFQATKLMRIKNFDQPFRHHRNSISPPLFKALDHRSDQQIDHSLQLHRPLTKLFRNNRHGGARSLSNPQCQMAGLASHGHDQVPASGRTGVHHEILHDLNPDVTRRLKAKRRDPIGKI